MASLQDQAARAHAITEANEKITSAKKRNAAMRKLAAKQEMIIRKIQSGSSENPRKLFNRHDRLLAQLTKLAAGG